jgi:hypothetical protein
MRLPLIRARRPKPVKDADHWDTGDPQMKPPVFRYREHGIAIDWLGHEGSVIAHGHIPLMLFAAATDALARRTGRASPTENWMAFLKDVRHQYARHAYASTPDNWRLHWGDVTAGTPGAFPVTIYGTGW